MLKITLTVEGLSEVSKDHMDEVFQQFMDDMYTIADAHVEEAYTVYQIIILKSRDEIALCTRGTPDDVSMYDNVLAEVEQTILQYFPSVGGVLNTTMEPYSE